MKILIRIKSFRWSLILSGIFCFCNLTPALAQESVKLQGKILNDSLEGSFINIINKTTNTGTINSTSGTFEIRVREQDTLQFSSIQYEKLEVVISTMIFEAGYLEVELIPGMNELDEVKISNITLTGNLASDISEMNIVEDNYGFKRHDRKERTLSERKLTAYGGSPVDALIGHLSGDIKRLKKVGENEKLQAIAQKAGKLLPYTFYADELKVPEDEIVNLIYFCAEDPQFKDLLSQENVLELMEYYKNHAPDFLKLYNLD
ncbi:hypothetical protein RM549_06590 [Salegentibacter sp. F188]|uniref:Carboxypeptidase-like regulatory domain-containing protein n=1 Tax=Autumnicola patrickiae TaxID=3075591 RepID=A0ABU3E0H0_9FLAO|nr:hypothetical protein [Salegentibacter sp. F188]MDT0689445.1 hypothetical protein [Salegentibacter sp. F188]